MGSRFESPAHLSVGYHISESESRSVVSDSLQPHELCSPWASHHVSCWGPLGIPLPSMLGPKSLCGVGAGT